MVGAPDSGGPGSGVCFSSPSPVGGGGGVTSLPEELPPCFAFGGGELAALLDPEDAMSSPATPFGNPFSSATSFNIFITTSTRIACCGVSSPLSNLPRVDFSHLYFAVGAIDAVSLLYLAVLQFR